LSQLIDDIAAGVIGNAGEGVQSLLSRADGNVRITLGSYTVFVESGKAARHGATCEMNGAV
jgi:uncharacterized Zn-binding protein involved in type VI secretion